MSDKTFPVSLVSEEIALNKDTIYSYIRDYVKSYLEVENIDVSKTPVIYSICKILSELSINQLFYSLVSYREFFLTQAKLPESIYNLAAFVAYSPKNAYYSETQLNIALRLDFASPQITIQIPKGTAVTSQYNSNDIVFRIPKDILIEISGGYPKSVTEIDPDTSESQSLPFVLDTTTNDAPYVIFSTSIKQLDEKVYFTTIPSDIKPYQFLTMDFLYSNQLYDVEVEVLETGSATWIPYKKYSSLFLLLSDSEGFVYKRVSTGGNEKLVRIFFGNSLIGKQPPPGSKVRVKIYETMGSMGNVPAYSITSLQSQVKVQDGPVSRTVSLMVGNPFPSSGGKDEEDLETVRYNSLQHISTIFKLVSTNDYKNLQVVDRETSYDQCIPILKRSDTQINDIQEYIIAKSETYDIITSKMQETLVPFRTEKLAFNFTFGLDPGNEFFFIPSDQVFKIDGEFYTSIFAGVFSTRSNQFKYLLPLKNQIISPNVIYQNPDYESGLISFVTYSGSPTKFRVNVKRDQNELPELTNEDYSYKWFCKIKFLDTNSEIELSEGSDEFFETSFTNIDLVPTPRAITGEEIQAEINFGFLVVEDSTSIISSELVTKALTNFRLSVDLFPVMRSTFRVQSSSTLGFRFSGAPYGREYNIGPLNLWRAEEVQTVHWYDVGIFHGGCTELGGYSFNRLSIISFTTKEVLVTNNDLYWGGRLAGTASCISGGSEAVFIGGSHSWVDSFSAFTTVPDLTDSVLEVTFYYLPDDTWSTWTTSLSNGLLWPVSFTTAYGKITVVGGFRVDNSLFTDVVLDLYDDRTLTTSTASLSYARGISNAAESYVGDCFVIGGVTQFFDTTSIVANVSDIEVLYAGSEGVGSYWGSLQASRAGSYVYDSPYTCTLFGGITDGTGDEYYFDMEEFSLVSSGSASFIGTLLDRIAGGASCSNSRYGGAMAYSSAGEDNLNNVFWFDGSSLNLACSMSDWGVNRGWTQATTGLKEVIQTSTEYIRYTWSWIQDLTKAEINMKVQEATPKFDSIDLVPISGGNNLDQDLVEEDRKVTFRIRAELSSHPDLFSSPQDFISRSKTSTYVEKEVVFNDATTSIELTIDITPVIQELVSYVLDSTSPVTIPFTWDVFPIVLFIETQEDNSNTVFVLDQSTGVNLRITYRTQDGTKTEQIPSSDFFVYWDVPFGSYYSLGDWSKLAIGTKYILQ